MRLCIAGSRTLSVYPRFITDILIQFKLDPVKLVNGCCPNGIDRSAERYYNVIKTSDEERLTIKYFHANWDEYGRAAGPIRNKQMAEYSDALLLIWDGESPGSRNMKQEMEKLNKPVYEVILRAPNNI